MITVVAIKSRCHGDSQLILQFADKRHTTLAHFQDEGFFLPRVPSSDDLIDKCCWPSAGPVR